MAFIGKSFVFDGRPCEDFDLMMYDFEVDQSGGDIATPVTILEEAIPGRLRPILLGTKQDRKLEFTLTFGVNTDRIDSGNFLDRYEIDAVANWLTGHDSYKTLAIEQDDMEYFYYRCMITSLQSVTYGNIPWALRATITCDSPYAYLAPPAFEYTVSDELELSFFNESSFSRYYYPKLEITDLSGTSFQISNATDDGRIFRFTGLPNIGSDSTIYVDNENYIITCSNGANLYDCFNKKFFRLKSGYNQLTITGNATLRIICEFPINIGG